MISPNICDLNSQLRIQKIEFICFSSNSSGQQLSGQGHRQEDCLSKFLGLRIVKRAAEYTFDKLHSLVGLQRIKNVPIC
jgi:hypothetical protein